MRREIGAQVALLRNREDILNHQMGDVIQKNREVPAVELGLQRLQRDAKVNADLLTLLKTKHQEALIKESEGIGEVTIIRPAPEPGLPAGAEMLGTVFVGALLGLLVGLVVAFVQETLDTSIGTIEDDTSRCRCWGSCPASTPGRRCSASSIAGPRWPIWSPRRCRAMPCSSRTSIPSRRWPRPTARCARTSSSCGRNGRAKCWWSPVPRCRRARPPRS